MMGGGGSIQNMLNSLRNNKILLRGRRYGFFKRELDYSQLRQFYKESQKAVGSGDDKPSKEELQAIRNRIRKEQIREQKAIWAMVSIVTCFVIVTFYIMLTKSVLSEPLFNQKITTSVQVDESIDNYGHNMELGMQKMKEQDWFFAAGYFNRALEVIPNDPDARYYLTKSYCKLCKYKKQACKKANVLVEGLIQQNPEKKKYRQLERYLTKKSE